jgi:hypothetical protein
MPLTPQEQQELDALEAEFAQPQQVSAPRIPVPQQQPQAQAQFAPNDPRDNAFTAGLYNAAASVPFAEKAAAGIEASIGAAANGEGFGGVAPRYNQARDQQKALNQVYDRDYNTAANIGYIGGAVANPANFALGKLGLLANAGMQAGSDTDFSKEGAGGEFAKQAGTNFLGGKLLQGTLGKLTGSGTKQKVADLLAKNVGAPELAAARKAADGLVNYGVDSAPAAMTGGKKITALLGEAAKEPRIAQSTAKATHNISKVLGKDAGKSDLGTLGQTISGLYDAAKDTTISKAGFQRFLESGSPASQYVQEAITKFPALAKQYGPNSGAVLQKAQEIARRSSIDEGDLVAKELSDLSGGLFDNANKGYALMQAARESAKPLYKTAATATKKEIGSQLDNKSANYARLLLNVPLAAARKTLGSVGFGHNDDVRNYLTRPSTNVRKQMVDILTNQPLANVEKAADIGSKNMGEKIIRSALNNPSASKVEQQLAIAATRRKKND